MHLNATLVTLFLLFYSQGFCQDLKFSYSAGLNPEWTFSPFIHLPDNSTTTLKYKIIYYDSLNSPVSTYIQQIDSFYLQNNMHSQLLSPFYSNVYSIRHNSPNDFTTAFGLQGNYYKINYTNIWNYPDSLYTVHYDSITSTLDTLDYFIFTYDSVNKVIYEYQKLFINGQWDTIHRSTMKYTGIHLTDYYLMTYDVNTAQYDTDRYYFAQYDSTTHALLFDGMYLKQFGATQYYVMSYIGNLLEKITCYSPFGIYDSYFQWNYPYFTRTDYQGNVPTSFSYIGKVNPNNGCKDSFSEYYNQSIQYTEVYKYDVNNYLTDAYRVDYKTDGTPMPYTDSISFVYDNLYPLSSSEQNQPDKRCFVYPNPASNKLFIQFVDEISRNLPLFIYNSSGQQVYADTIPSHRGTCLGVIQIENLSAGEYYLKLGSLVSTFIKY